MKNNKFKSASKWVKLSCSIIPIIVLAQTSKAQVSITVSPNANGKTANIALSGSLSLLNTDLFGNNVTSNDALITSKNNSYAPFGINRNSGMPIGRDPFVLSRESVLNNIGPGLAVGTVIVTDSSNGGATLISYNVDTLSFRDSGSFRLSSSTGPHLALTDSMDSGDIMTFSGSFDFNLNGDSYADVFSEGKYSGLSNGQAVNFTVTSVPVLEPVPEPSSALLIGLGSVGLLLRRKRR